MRLLALVGGEAERVLPHAARLRLTPAELQMRLNAGQPPRPPATENSTGGSTYA